MKLHTTGLAVLSLAIALGLSACGGKSDSAASSPEAAPASAPAAGDKVAAEISGAGASFIFPLVSKWSADYNAATGAKINYQSIGSGGGIAQIKAGTVDFGSSDKPLSSEELAQAGLGQFPSAIGGVVPVVNLEGIQPGQLRLSGALLADIFLGRIKTWNDKAIAAANPGVALPATKITLVHRSDGSGTTFNFSNYLSKVSGEWKDKVGEGTSVQWPDGVGGKGNEGVASYVQQIKGSLGYVELAYALQNNMPYASMQNAAGNWVQPTAETFAAEGAIVEDIGSAIPYHYTDIERIWGGVYDVFAADTARGLKGLGFDVDSPQRELLSPSFLTLVDRGMKMSAMTYMGFNHERSGVFDAVNAIFQKYDLLLTPTNLVAAIPNAKAFGETFGPDRIGDQTINPTIGWSLTYLFNLTGHPIASVPVGLTPEGLPVGMQIVGPRHADFAVLSASAGFERAKPWAASYGRLT